VTASTTADSAVDAGTGAGVDVGWLATNSWLVSKPVTSISTRCMPKARERGECISFFSITSRLDVVKGVMVVLQGPRQSCVFL
jgi:hypothetical protein